MSGRGLNLDVETIVDGNREKIGKRINWSIEKVEPDEIVLGAVNENTTYKRKAGAK